VNNQASEIFGNSESLLGGSHLTWRTSNENLHPLSRREAAIAILVLQDQATAHHGVRRLQACTLPGLLQGACVGAPGCGQAYRLRNVERLRAANRAWQRNNPERYKANQRRWRERNPGRNAELTAIWRANNLDRARAAQRACNRKLKDAAYAAYGGYRCKCCGETLEAFLSLDHVNNDGAAHRKQTDRRKLYKWLQREGYPPGFQVLCMNCNFGKARNGGVCPHQAA